MSQTWKIKDTAPVDEDSYILNKVDISFTSGGEKFVGIEMYDDGMTHVGLAYYRNDGTTQIAATVYYGDPGFAWTADNEKYKTLVFDTAPTGELLAWLQKNADEQSDPEYLTLKSELTLVANAIRAKGGTSASLVYPDGFVTAIQAIQTGGGNYNLQAKSVTPTKEHQSITPDQGYYGLSGVTVGAIPENYQDVSGVTATAAHVLDGDKFVDATGTVVTGTMANNGAVAKTMDGLTVTSVTIEAGYTSGGTVSLTNDIEMALAAI